MHWTGQRRALRKERVSDWHMRKSLKKLLGGLWLVSAVAMPLCVVVEALADDTAEIETTLTGEAKSSPGPMAASPKLLSATGGEDIYWATGELRESKTLGATINLQFNIPKSYTYIKSAILTMNAWDVDTQDGKERDVVSFNKKRLGKLYGGTDRWDLNQFTVPASAIHSGINNLRIVADADKNGWWTQIGWAKLVIKEAYIKLKASSNHDDRIKLSWDVSAVMSGEKYYIDRRRYETDPFVCLNKDDPTSDSHYNDKSCSPGVKYYYRVRSKSGVVSNHVVGKRVAKKTRPRFGFVLTGSEYPEHKGSDGESNVLVAGKTITCMVYTMNTTQPLPIKRVELIGTPIGGPANRQHKILWITRSSVSENVNFSNYVDHYGKFDKVVILSDGSVMKPLADGGTTLTATLKSGPGFHGAYQWEVRCEFADRLLVDLLIDGAWPAETHFSKNVYFDKYGIDNGESVTKLLWNGVDWEENKYRKEYNDIVPNWYAYWKDDGACPSLWKIGYRGKPGVYGESIPRYVDSVYVGSREYIDDTIDKFQWTEKDITYTRKWIIKIDNQYWSEQDKVFGIRRTKDGRDVRVYGIYHVEATVAHELQHAITRERYHEMVKFGNLDSDKAIKKCYNEIVANGICSGRGVEFERQHGDGIVDNDEIHDYFGREFFNVYLGISKDWADTYNLQDAKSSTYSEYGDNELVSMFAGRKGMKNAIPDNDWAYPGERSGGFPAKIYDVKPDSTTHAKTRSNSSARLMATPSEEVSTNLMISITEIRTV